MGISIAQFSTDNLVEGNHISLSKEYGVWVEGSSNGNIFCRNSFSNRRQVYSNQCINTWDDGYPSGGNYWSNYRGGDTRSGPNQDQPGNDSIGDTPYIIDTNNQDRYPLMDPFEPRTHDIRITDTVASKTIVGRGYTVTIEITVENQGDFMEEFNVTVRINKSTLTTRSVMLIMRSLTSISFMWNTTDFERGSYILDAYASPVPGETDTEDNTSAENPVIVTIAGDNDGDRDVDIFDIVSAAAAYGSEQPDSRYDQNSDIDDDGDIDIFDMVIAAGNYGKSW